MKLVIVESPAKAKTIEKFLGKDYRVVASYGHIRDLPSNGDEIPDEIRAFKWGRLGVNVEGDFRPYYVESTDGRKRKVISELKKLLKDADELLLATDEDREGEAISWHLVEVLKPRVPVKRITFNEITKKAITEAVANPRTVDERRVRAQEGRRILDRLFGYELSPVLWRKVRQGLSAGRVQSVALRLVVEREEERLRFVKAEYWDAEAHLREGDLTFPASLVSVGGKRVAEGKDFEDTTGKLRADAKDVVHLTGDAANAVVTRALGAGEWTVTSVKSSEGTMKPAPPFTTSTLQQAASSALGMTLRRTMQAAQRLYEGVDLGGGDRVGLITYMRTDSVALSGEALAMATAQVKKMFGEEYHQFRTYATKNKSAQEAHEAIRPTDLSRTPESLQGVLEGDELAVYDLIWRRTMACQMAEAKVKRTAAEFTAADAIFRANGSIVIFPGFLKVMGRRRDDVILPELREGQRVPVALDKAPASSALHVAGCAALSHETQPPARYSEASLVKKLEEAGIGRPSTYASIVSTIMDREYVIKKGTALVPTYTGMVVTELLRRYFEHFIDVTFTAQMEDRLDDIADGKVDWLKFLADFYKGGGDFGDGLHPAIEKQLPGMDFAAIPLGKDPKSGEDVVVKVGRFGPFVQRGSGDTSLLATIPPDAIPDEFRLDQALTALEQKTKGDDVIGTYPPTGEPIYLIRNYRGAYLQVGETPPKEKGKKAAAAPKPRRASLTAEDDADNLTLERALKLLELPRLLGNHPETGKPVEANNGMFGPYVAHDGEYRSLKKDDDVYTVTLERAVELMFVPKSWRGGPRAAPKLLRELGSHPDTGRGVRLFDMGGAPTLYDGKTTTVLSRSVDPKSLALDEALVILSEAAAKAAPKKGRGAKKASTKAPAKPRAKKTATKPATRKSAPKSTAGAKKVAKKPAAKKVSAK